MHSFFVLMHIVCCNALGASLGDPIAETLHIASIMTTARCTNFSELPITPKEPLLHFLLFLLYSLT